MHITEQKSALRSAMEQRLSAMPERVKQAESRTICREILRHIPTGSRVCAYYPLATEADLRPLIQEILARGDAVFLPCSEKDRVVFRRILNLRDLKPGKFSIPEPPAGAPVANPEEIDIVLVPGRAFDRRGNRLGRGNGGYDHWIREQRGKRTTTHMWGVALECQMVADVPYEDHDERLDAIVTPRGLAEATG